jgi:hypothetical protein
MDVRHLHHSEQRQQGQAHHSHQHQSARLWAAAAAEMCLQSGQTRTPALRIHRFRCARSWKVYRALGCQPVQHCQRSPASFVYTVGR